MKRKKIPFKKLYETLYSELPEETKQYFKLRIIFEELKGYFSSRIILELIPKKEMYITVLLRGEELISKVFENVLRSVLNAKIIFSEARLYKDGDKLSPYLVNIKNNPIWGTELLSLCNGYISPMKSIKIFLDFYVEI